jgi:hypothetical protein
VPLFVFHNLFQLAFFAIKMVVRLVVEIITDSSFVLYLLIPIVLFVSEIMIFLLSGGSTLGVFGVDLRFKELLSSVAINIVRLFNFLHLLFSLLGELFCPNTSKSFEYICTVPHFCLSSTAFLVISDPFALRNWAQKWLLIRQQTRVLLNILRYYQILLFCFSLYTSLYRAL